MSRTIKIVLLVICLLALFLTLSSLTWAMTGTNYAIPTDTIDQSGGKVDGTTYKMQKQTLGQTVVGQSTSTNYILCHGWLCGADDPYISFSIAGVASGTAIADITTDITSTASGVQFGALPFGSSREAASLLTVTINTGTYTTTVQQNQDLTKGGGGTIAPFPNTNASPAVWSSPVSGGYFGYHTTDYSLGTGTADRFHPDASYRYAKFESTAYEVAYNEGPVSAQQTYIVYRIEVTETQAPGDYSNTVTYIISCLY